LNRLPQIPDALMSLRPNAQWVLRGDTYGGLEWLDQVQSCPTEQEVNDEIARLADVWALSDCEKQAKLLISEVDWAVLPDVDILNKTDFETYRADLRQLIFNPVPEPVWPERPTAQWQ